MLAGALVAPTQSAFADWSKSTAKVMLDPGHGGSDPGAVYNGGGATNQREAFLALWCCQKMNDWLNSQKSPHRMTRSGDATVSLSARRSASISYDPWVFCSVHLNAASAAATGTETWHYWGGRSYTLASKVQSRLVGYFGRANRGVKQEAWTVITGASYIPAVLTEGLFITNPTEWGMIKDANSNSKGFKGWVNGHLCGFYDFMNSEGAGLSPNPATNGWGMVYVAPVPDPKVTVSPGTIDFHCYVNEHPEITLNISGTNLKGDISIACSSARYALVGSGVKTAENGTTSVTIGKGNGTVNTSYKVRLVDSKEAGSWEATWMKLTVKSSGISDIAVPLKCTITAPPLKDFDEKWNVSEEKNNFDSKGYDATKLRNFCYNAGKIYAVYNHKDIIVLNAQTGAKLGFLKRGDVVKGGTLQLCDVKATSDGKIVACNIATAANNENLRLYVWDNDNANPYLLKEIAPADFKGANRLGDCLEVNGDLNDCWFSFGNQNGATRIIEWHKTGNNWAQQSYEVVNEWGSNLSTLSTVRVYHQNGGWWIDGKDSYPSWCTLSNGKAVRQTLVDTGESWGSSHHEFKWQGLKYAANLIFNLREYKKDANGKIITDANGNQVRDDDKNYIAGRMRIVQDPTGDFKNATTVGEWPAKGLGSVSRNTNSTGDVIIRTDGSNYIEAWVLSTTQGIAYYTHGTAPANNPSAPDLKEPEGDTPTPRITVDKNSVSLSAEPNKTATATVAVKGASLTGKISAWIEGSNASLFSVAPATLEAAGGNMTVTYTPTAAGSHSATLCLASDGAGQVNVALTGKAEEKITVTYADEVGTLQEGWLYSVAKGNLAQAPWFSIEAPFSRSMAVIGDNLYVLNCGTYSNEPVVTILDANTGAKKGELSAKATTSGGQLARATSIGAIGNDLYLVNAINATSHNFRVYKYTNAQGEPALICDKAGVVGGGRSAGFGANRIAVSNGVTVWYIDVNNPGDIKSITLEEAITNGDGGFAYEPTFCDDGTFWINQKSTMPRHYNAEGKLIETLGAVDGVNAQGASSAVFNYGKHKYIAATGTPGVVWDNAHMTLVDITAGAGSPVFKQTVPETFGTGNWGGSAWGQNKVLAQLSGDNNSMLKLWCLIPLQGIGHWKFDGKTGSGVENIAISDAENDVEAVYYNLQGVRVNNSNLTPGLYIRRAGTTSTKVLVK